MAVMFMYMFVMHESDGMIYWWQNKVILPAVIDVKLINSSC